MPQSEEPCWKCDGVCSCSPGIEAIKEKINNAKALSDNLGDGLQTLKDKIEEWKGATTRLPVKDASSVLNKQINYLCLMIDELYELYLRVKEGGDKVSGRDIKELACKANTLIDLSHLFDAEI